MAELFAATGDSVAHIIRQGDVWNAKLLLKDSNAQCLTLDPHHPGTFYVGTHGKGVWKSSDNGQTWQNMRLPQEDVFSIAVSPVDGAVYAGCEPSMLFRSEDGGNPGKNYWLCAVFPQRRRGASHRDPGLRTYGGLLPTHTMLHF